MSAGDESSLGWIIKPSPFTKDLASILTLMTPIDLQAMKLHRYGGHIEAELSARLGWRNPVSGQPFYARGSVDHWYYDVNMDKADTKGDVNHVGHTVQGQAAGSVRGDIVIVRGGPVGSEYDRRISKRELADAILFCTEVDPLKVFSQREQSRFLRKMGLSGMAGMFGSPVTMNLGGTRSTFSFAGPGVPRPPGPQMGAMPSATAAPRPAPPPSSAASRPATASSPSPPAAASSSASSSSSSSSSSQLAEAPSSDSHPDGGAVRQCDRCGAQGQLRVCACRAARYCGVDCQRQAWKEHKATCTYRSSRAAGQ